MLTYILVSVLVVLSAICLYFVIRTVAFWYDSKLYSNIFALERRYATKDAWGGIKYWIQDLEDDSFTSHNSRGAWCKLRPDGILFICSCTFPYRYRRMLIPFSDLLVTKELELTEFQAFPITLLAGNRFLEIKVRNSPCRIIVEEKHADKIREAILCRTPSQIVRLSGKVLRLSADTSPEILIRLASINGVFLRFRSSRFEIWKKFRFF